ncbi:MAG: redoxin domain-containing protein [Rhodothermales bacterium]
MTKGQKAPDFTLFNTRKRPVTLSDACAKGPVLLLFYPAAFTGVCTNELNMVSNDLDAYGPAQVFGVSTDTLFTQAEFAKANAFKIEQLSDHDGEVSAAFGAKYDANFGPMKYDRIAKRSAFLIDRDGVIQYAEVLENPGNLPDLEAIRVAISEIA